jgi:hypothetical protein
MILPGAPKDSTSDKFLFGIGIAAFCALAVVLGSVALIGRTTDSNPAGAAISGSPAPLTAPTAQNQTSGVAPHAGVQPAASAATPGIAATRSDSALAAQASGNPAVTPAPVTSGSNATASSAVAHSAGTGQQVLPADLNNLADGVKLDDGALQNIDKAEWAKELPNAENLLQGICDCEQRNWLNRFVQTANDALAGSSDYYTSVQILDQLPRNDTEMTTHTVSN